MKKLLRYFYLIPVHVWTVLRDRGPAECWHLFAGFLVPLCLFRLSFSLSGHKASYNKKVTLLRRSILLGGVLIVFGLGCIFLPVLWAAALALCFGITIKVRKQIRSWQETKAMLALARELTERAKQKRSGHTFTTLDQMHLSPEIMVAISRAQEQSSGEELVIARIDAKGRTLGVFGPIPHRLPATEQDFIKRARNPVDIVLIGKKVLVRKQMSYSRSGFVREWFALVHLMLNSKVRVPLLHRVDEEKCLLYMDYVPGRMMNSIAPLFDDQRRLLQQYFPETFLTEVEKQFDEVHRCGIASLDIGYGNVVEDSRTGLPVLIDFEVCRHFQNRQTFAFAYARNRDRFEINYSFRRNLLTEQAARKELQAHRRNGTGWYAPIDFGLGLGVPGFWSIDAGTGRWEHFNGPIITPLVRGKRILDLGSNNGAMPMMMLRSGAKEVLCVEQQDKFIRQGQLVLRLFQWRDIAQYNLNYRQGNMLEILKADWGSFDMVTAFCSLYHLDEADMQRVVRKASTLSPMMILQGNLHDGTFEKSSVEFLKNLLETNGYQSVEIHAPAGYARPLLIGRRG